jgi:predicted helicase
MKLKGHYFNTIEVIKAESQALLNTLSEHDFQDAFKKMAEALGMVHTRGRVLL